MATVKELELAARAARAEAEVSRLRRPDPAKEYTRAVAAEAVVAELTALNADLSRQVMAFQGGEAYELGVIHGSAGAGKEIGGLRERVAELEGQIDRLTGAGANYMARAAAAEAQVARVREALEILERNSTGTPASGEEANSWMGTQDAIADVQAALGPASNLADRLEPQVEATSGLAGSPSSRADL